MPSYEETLHLNEQIVTLVLTFQESKDTCVLTPVHSLLGTINNQIATQVCRKLHLSYYSSFDDMIQEAYIKLLMLAPWFDPQRTNSFVSLWRKSLYNHLLTIYFKNTQFSPLWDSEVCSENQRSIECKVDFEEVKRKSEEWIRSWKQKQHIPLSLALLEHRIMALPDKMKSQDAISQEFNRTQTFISKWENWLRAEIKRLFRPDNYGESDE